MRTSVALLAYIFFTLIPLAAAQLSYHETDKIVLNVSVFDPDSDAVSIAYSSPLGPKGEWQTTYGDAGVYEVNVTVSDGALSSSEKVIVVVNRKEEPPEIAAHRPKTGMLSMREGRSLTFFAKATDRNNDALEYVWAVDGKNISKGEQLIYVAQYTDQGNHTIALYINDGILTTMRSWDILVRDVDLGAAIMSQYGDITFNENDMVRIPLPDSAYYGTQYTISPPLEKGFWKTGYNSSGLYKVTIHVFGKGYDGKKTIRVRVLNVDRKPTFSPHSSKSIEEGKEISFAVSASDPDGDKIALTLKNAPQGATLSNGVFTWTPSHDVVQHTGISTRIPRSLHLLSKTLGLEFIVSANNLSASLTVPMTVFNTNRAPRLTHSSSLALKEGDLFLFDANATDPDNDPLDFTYESTLKRDSTIGYTQAGSHVTRVIATDGFLQDEMFVPLTVGNTNRAPTLAVPSQKINENQSLVIELQGKDEDNDPMAYSLVEGPKGMKINGNTLSYTPDFDAALKRSKIVFASVSASDGSLEAIANVSIEVRDINRAPVLNEPTMQKLTAQRGKPIVLRMNATDSDEDSLEYTWRFGWFDSYKGGSSHTRMFVAKGEKTVTVTATDGEFSIKKRITVVVV